MTLTQTEENYLKAIFLAIDRGGNNPVRTNDIASALDTKASSVTDMLKKLAEKEFIIYAKYKPIDLSDKGRAIATHLIRKHRLWETFLVENLGFNWAEVHIIAEQLEHIQSHELVQKLDDYLGNPLFDPHGDPIPNSLGEFPNQNQILLSALKAGECGRISSVQLDDKSFLDILNHLKIKIGSSLMVEQLIHFDDTMKVNLNNQQTEVLSKKICDNIYVIKF